MKLLTLTREYPPNVYGGAGVVVEQLTRALSHRMAVEVRCFSEGGPESVRVARRRSDRGDMRCLGELCRISVRNVASRNNLCGNLAPAIGGAGWGGPW